MISDKFKALFTKPKADADEGAKEALEYFKKQRELLEQTLKRKIENGRDG